MVDGHNSMDMDKSPEGSGEDSQTIAENKENTQQQTTNGSTPTTTISTIAVQSGETRLVIALLQSGEWLRLKVLEVQPELTKLGSSVKEATELSNAHNEVLLRLQSKQSPVEELLRQADQLISTQRPRAEVYAAMAETLGQAWRDVNDLLERRKQILDSNVLFQCRAEECGESMKALEMACNDTLLPIEIEAVKNFLSKIHDLRKTMLEALMGALQEGKILLDKLKEIANEGTLDSRPDKIKIEADHAVLKVERWLEDLHDKRRLIEASFRSRKTQLEQCLALALLATDLRDLEEILNDRIAALSSTCDQLGDSSSSAELLLFELKKLQAEAKEFQDRSIKITKSTERLVSSGHFAGEQATEQAYAILGAAADYVNDLDQYETLLNRAVAFFEAARSAITKLDQLEIQLVTTEHPPFSTRLARFHAQTVSTIEDVTSKPLMEGYALLDITGRGAPGAEGVKRTVEELESRKIRLLERCTAHEEENLEISRMINVFLEKHEELHIWLTNIAEAFLQGHQDMGSDLPMAKDFYRLHSQLLDDLEKRTSEVEHLEFEVLPIRERLDEAQRREFQTKIIDLQNSWTKTKNIVAHRIDLGFLYVQFHEIVDELRNKIESLENELKSNADVLNETKIEDLKSKWNALQPVYLRLSNSGKVFLDEAAKINDPYLDIPRACLCVETLLEKFANRQLTITESWEKWQTTIKILRERRIEHERKIEESTRTLEWVSKFGEQLYPVITCQSIRVDSILRDLEGSRRRILPELNKAVDELDARIKSIDNLVEKGQMQIDQEMSERLSQMYDKLHSTAKNYKDLLMSLISIFECLHEVEHKTDEAKTKVDYITSFSKSYDVDGAVNDLEMMKRTITESMKHIQTEIEAAIVRIKQLEPPDAALQDIEKLRQALDNVVSPFQTFTVETLTRIEEHRRICIFGEDLSRIDSDLRDLNDQLQTVDGRSNENLQAAKAAAATFSQFEATMTILEQRIDVFVRTTEDTIVTSAPHVRNDLTSLKEKWRDLKSRMENSKKRMVLCIQYFELLEEAKEWYREGGKLLIVIARKATSVKVPKDATDLLQEIDNYLKPGEQNQENRIERLKELSTIIFGTDRLPQFNEVIVENRQMLDSFAVISSELRTLVQNLQNAEDLREKLRMEKLEADEKLHAVKREMAAAEAARNEAENARKMAEKIAAETLERAEMEAKRLKEEKLAKLEAQKIITQPPSFSVSAQTDKFESTDERYIHESHTSAVTKKEIHILQKMEVEKIVPIVQKEPSPPKQITEESYKSIVHEVEQNVSPEFTIPLNDATVQEGERFTFECRLIGYPIPEVVWYKDGISILNNPDYLTTFHQGICTLTIEETFAEDSARFTCKAFNNLGSAETSAMLTVKETAPEEQPSPPVFVKELQPSVAIESSSHRLECTVEGNPLPTVQWYKNETNIDNSPDYIITYNNGEACLSFEEVFLDDRAIYTCKATNRLGQVSTSAVLDVESMEASTEKPYFLTPLSNAMARAGQRVKLECEATGNPIPRLSWTHDGKPIDETIHTKIQTESGRTSLIISEAFPKDAGCYTVIAKNDVGEASVSCNVSVKGRLPRETSDSEFACSDMEPTEPKIQLRLKDHEVLEGHTVRLDCIIVGQPEPEVIWYHNDKPVKESADFQLLFQGDKCSLIIHEAFVDDAGVYRVVAINSGGETSSQCTLKVIQDVDSKDKEPSESAIPNSPPKFVKLPTDSLVAEGEDVSFECAVTGEPKPDVKWYFDNNEIVADKRILIKQKEDGTIMMKILSAIPEDKGNYVVKATNICGEAKAFARLVVRSLSDFRKKEEFVKMEEKLIPPSFKERFTSRLVPEGVSTKFECIAIGKPAPKIQWLFNDRPVHGKDFLVSVSGDRQVLTIPETGSSHAGTISCVAENTAGKATCNAKLEIDIEPKKEEGGIERVLELVEVKPVEDMHAASSSDKHFSAEKMSDDGGLGSQILTKMSQTITESTTTHTSTKKEFISSMMSSSTATPGQEPTSVTVKSTVHSTEQSTSENGAPPVVQSQKVEEFEKIVQDQPGEIRQEKTVVVSQGEEGIKRDGKTMQVQKPIRKSTAPRFVSPLTGMIVDQGADVVVEGIVDGYPQPNISWSKNGQELQPKDGAKTSYAHNHVRLELKNVNVKNAGRYTCTASNECGSASSTADLVVKKTIFPPVFGRRLQAQVVKRGDRVLMEVEITGTPEPTVIWYKDDVPVKEQPPALRIRQQGNCYILQIDKAEKVHAGKYMVRATNAGGEAQSIADFAVFEPTPDTMTEVHKTVIYENVQDKKIIQETVYTTDLSSHRKMDTTRKVQAPSPSPSKFVKGEFRESDYESDYDGRISSVWKPRGTETDDRSFKPVKSTLTGSGKPIVATPSEKRIEETSSGFDQRTSMKEVEQESRIEDRSIVTPTKIKQVLLPGSPPEIAYAPPHGRETYYEARAGMPYHNAIGTETRKTVRMDESTENSRRIVTVEQTSRVIKFGDGQKTTSDLGPVDSMKTQKQQKSYYRVPTPKKFVQGQFRESDYESDVDSSRIRPKWAPADSDSEDPRYRRVQPPSGKSIRSSSLPVRQEHVVSPLEFDTGPPPMKRQTSMTQLRDEIKTSKLEAQKLQQPPFSRQDEQVLQPGSPPEFGFVSRNDVKKAANHVASRHMSDMTSTFKSKTEKFVSDIQSDLKQGKPILKHPAESRVSDSDEPRTYREESRVAEHGMKQIDPDTGLIYFKYDFGYEFGIVLPGEGKKTITSTNKTIQGQRRASDIEVPIVHEFTTKKENGYAKKGTTTSSSSTRSTKSATTKFGPSKTVKWEPTSESEFSEAEDTKNARRRYPGVGGDTMPPPPSLVIPCSPSPSRWDYTTPSPLSLSPSLPSLSPRYSSATGPPSNVDSAGSPWPTSNGVASTKEVIQPYLEILPKKAPLFITPLRDIAVVSGQTARFECIVQAEPQPNILWSKDGRIIENSSNFEIHYRNGVCRLTIAHAFPDDAGTYACTATNGLGSTVTSATLQVPGVSLQYDTSNPERSVDEELLECSPRYVALKDLFLPQEEIKLTLTNHRHASIYEFALAPSYSCEDGSYLENRAGEYEYDERTGEPYAKPKRLDFSDIERNGTYCDLNQDDENEDDLHTQLFRRIESNVQGEIVMQTTPTIPTFTGRPGDPSPPVFEQIFKNARFAQGGNAIFEGCVRGNPKPNVSWTHKGAPLLESRKIRMSYDDKTGMVTLQINQIGPGDEGEYTCSAKNQYGEAICSVYIQPEGFGPPPQQQLGSYKKEFAQTFQTTEQKTGSQTYQQRSYQQMYDKRSYVNGTSSIEDFKVDTFEYRLLRETEFRESITRRFVGESDSQISTVIDRSLGPVAPAQIVQKPRNSKLIEGSDAVFTAKITGNPKPRLTWFKNGQRIRDSQRVEMSYSNQQATLKIRVALPEDSGHYTLLSENQQGCTVSSAYLAIESSDQVDQAVHQMQQRDIAKSQQIDSSSSESETGKVLPPNFVRTCADREATEGKMTRFDCRVTGRPYPDVTWYINGQQVANDLTHKILVNESGNNSLMITNVSRSDAGVVTCIARNKAGETSFQCNLNVIEKEQVVAPKFVERFTTTNVKEGEPVVFTARAVGTPVPRITWQKDGVPIAPGPDVRISMDGSGASTLDIPCAKFSDAAWYQCTAQNVAGSTATRARLFVETPKGAAPEPRRLNLPRPTKIIEPEPTPGPEVIYLRHVERAKPYLPPPEEDKIYPPPRFIIPLRDVHQIEGGRIHFEARIEPVGDPTMRVEWYVNGRALDASSRATSIFRFGFISLDLISIVLQDSGEYLCRVVSSTGVAESRATLSVTPRATIEQASQHPDSLQYIQQLEDYSKYQRQESVEEISSSQRPVFIRPLQDLGELQEGRNAHFEAQLTPVSDPTMKVEWYKDGRPITASSRITTIFNFGYVSLNILHLRAEDAGSYTVKAVNRLGEAISSATLRVFARTSVTTDLGIPEQQRYIEAAEELEAYQQAIHQKYVQEQPEPTSPPEFKSPIKDQNGIREGGFAHFEARLEPVGDADLRVEWLKDGRPVEASSRITTFFNFGYVALTIKYVTIHDVGVYTCRAYNRVGEAHTTAQLSVISKNDVIYDSQHPTGLQRIQTLEDSSKYMRQVQEEVQVKQAPRFLGTLKGTNKIVEGQRAHFEARVEPQSDLTMKIEWYHNGKSITAANRIQTYHDFGYVAIDILQVRPEDAGTYTVVARNALGEAQLSATMIVETRSSVDTSSMHRGTFEKTQRLEESKFVEPQYHIEEISKSKPIFVQPLSDPKPVSEGKNIHLECRLEPMGDPTMRVEWFQNGRPVTVGSRFRTYYDFGFVALDIVHSTIYDSGEYTVRATNHLGTAHTSACVRVIGRSDVVTETQNEQSLEQIQMLEDSSKYRKTQQEEVTVMQAPQFTRALHNIETVELTNVHLECRLQPVGDATMRVEWFVNGRPVKTGHRFRPSYEFDYVALDILGVYPEDSGVYTCQATNQLGEAVTSCSVRVHAKKDLLLESQHPEGLERIQYLEDASRYKRHELVDEVVTVKPKFITSPKNQENLREGQHAHFECKLEPVTDSNLKVEWYKNGRPVTIGHRFRPIHDFGYVALDVIDLIAEDSGTYTCRAVNLVGSDEVSCTLSCRSTAQILTDTRNESGLEQIHYLEDRSKYHRQEVIEETTTQAPIFTTSLNNVEIKEGQRAHFECRLIPVSDTTMKVEWFHNNTPVKAGSRFVETNSFGFVALDIMYAYPDDSGTYTCRAKNIIGEAITSATAVVHSKKSIYMESHNEEALERLRYLEDTSRYQRKTVQEETVTQAPVFTMPIKDLRVAENQAAHFEARVIPVGDSKLKVEWLRNGVPIAASNRVTTMHDFGYVALNMKYVNPEDSGTYTCRATNDLGEAVTSATLFVQSKAALQFESQHESALSKLQALEDTSKYQRREEEEIVVKEKPSFTVQLNGPSKLVEGQSAHYECRIEPYPDPNMKVEWFHNGKPLSTGHRYRTACDFGFASLDVLTVYAEDSGTYTCQATNKLGTAKSSINLDVKSRSSIIRETQHESALKKIQYLEDDSRYKRTEEEDFIIAEKPKFGRPLKNIEHLPEGKNAHLEATLTPVNDPTMIVEWFRDGRPVPQGHKFKTTYDFGYVALDILYAYPEDSGTYMCKARNAVGEAVTTCVISVDSKQGLFLDTLDAQRLQKIRELETVEIKEEVEKEVVHQKPVFLTPLNNLDHLKEGEHAHLECRVEPINDPNLKIEWFVNGVAVRTGHRFRTTHDFGYVALDILYTYPEDSGTYMCKATNLAGEAVNTCTIKVGSRRSILLDTQHPDGLEKIRELEAQGHPARLEVEEPPLTPPRFVSELRGTTEVYEGQTAHFECQVEPLHDANLRIEFFHNGKPLPSASRFHMTFDFGYVALDISHTVPEDAGQYSVKAINALGQCVSSIELKVIPRDNIILDSQRPEGMDKIRELEAQQPWKRPDIPEPQTRQRPVFTQPLQNIDAIPEGHTAHFECRLIPVGDPTLKVEWFRNEVPLETSSRITKVHDFGYVALDITHVRDEDEGVYMCRASNPLGEAVTTASMKIKTKASIQLDTQHPEAQRRIAQLEADKGPSRAEEPDKVFDKPIFTQLLTGPTELWEGQLARYECRVVPVGDASLRFEWYMNGIELKMGSRFHVNHDFGYVTLDILKVIPEDSGVYTCKAINKSGEAVSSISLKVKARSAIDAQSIQPDAWQKIQLKEAEMNKVPEMFVDTTPQQAPVFTKHLESYDKLVEGQHVYLEAQVEPRADPNLRVEWFKNGISLQTGTRLRSTFDFGLVTLSINGLRPDDSAIYTCKATNLLGEAVSTCSLKIVDRHWLLGDTLHPDALPKIDALEQPQIGTTEPPEPVYEEPVFITHLNNVECVEGDNVHFECNVEPSKDPTMKIEWFMNGKPLPTGARFKSTYDFGYVALDITHSYEEDSGIVTVKATNSKGTAQTSGTLKCISKQSIYLQTQHPQGEAGLEKVKEAEDAYLSKYRRPDDKPEHEYPKPIWTVPLQPEFKLGESEPLHLEGQVEPKDDPNLKIEWYFNGKALEHGARFKMTSDFGFVTLDLTDVYDRDSGIYTCKAYNKAGEAFTSTTVYCSTKESIIEKSQHPKGKEGLEAIQDLEESLKRQDGALPESEEGHPPVFTSQFENLTNLSEGEIAHFEASLTPTGDQTMVVEWFYNGKSLEASHRTRTVYAFGMVVLEVLGTKIEDSGTYSCRATNKWGKAEISVQLECVDKSKGQKPKFTTHIQSLEGLKDGQSVHFECTLIPVGDPHMKVEWFHNGQPLRHSSRFKMVSDFGFVVMDIAGVMSHDTGEYVCKASNKYGEDYTKATIKCFGKSGVYLDSLQPDSLARIRELESYGGEQPTTPTTPVAEPPKFITQIADITKLVEGQSAHFEARLTPVNDPDLKVEWYYNGKKLPHGHRYRTFHDFGIVILDILYCYEENSGVYECRAFNKYGEDTTKATLKCFSKSSLILESQLPKGMEGGLEKIQTLEDSMIRTRDEKTVEERGKAPVFTVPLSNIDGLREGESAHFEARLTPTDDPRLKVEWFWNGKPLRTGSRFRTFCDFGFVILEISPIYPEDSGEYSCRAINDYGEAVTTCTMKCTGKRSIILESQLPKGMESTIDKIAELEGLGNEPGQPSPDDDTGKPPEFITTPSDLTLAENSLAHFECRLVPINDSSMRVEWFHNGKPLLAGTRVKTIHDFGFVILEVANCYQRDSGLYTCKATNRHGEATVSCKLQVRGRQGIILEPQLPSNFKTGTESIQKLEESLYKKDEILAEEETPNPPRFIVELKDIEVEESGPSHFDCRVEPVGDPTMRVEWYHNGRPFATGSRVHQINDFGFISLDMSYTYARDSGEYVCRATNKWGTATTKATITCKSKKTIDFDSQLPSGMSGEKLKELERGPISEPPVEEAPREPPRFITQIQSATVDESEPVRFECRVEPKDDPNLRIEWYRNGKIIPAGHRYRTVYDMGFVSMDILYVYPEDSGEYVCKAINDLGEDTTKASVSCKKLPSIILQNQVPKGMKKSEALMQMEATIKKYTSEVHLTEDDLYDADKKQPPRFVTQIQDQTELVEMNSTKFECQLAPVGDPNMKVEWFFNGKPLPQKNRFTPIYDFGYVAMNFGWVYPEDSGEYLCRATNLYGMDETRAIIRTAGKPGIIYESQLPKGMKSIEKIREMEAAWQIVPEEEGEEEKVRAPPVFVSKPEPVTVEEGDWSRFCCRVTGHPRPRVMWILNGHTVVNGSRYKLTYDGMYHLDIPKTRQYDHGKVEVIARSSVGESRTETFLTVKQRSDDYRGVLKNSPRPWYDYGLTQYQSERQNTELERVFEERHQTVSQGIEIATEHLGQKVFKEPEAEWQKSVKNKKNEDYYQKLMSLEEEQVLKESRLRETSHQFAIPGDKVVSHSVAKGMAQKYQESLETQDTKIQETTQVTPPPQPKFAKKPHVTEVDIDTERLKGTGRPPPEPSESLVHGREVHVAKQKQTQKEVKGDLEITRKITATETTEVEHKAKTQERVVQGQVKPAKPPVFTKKIQPCRAFEQEQARFEVEFDGDPLPTIKWYREDFPIQNSPDLQIYTFSTKSVLIIRQVFMEDSAVFSVIAENRGGKAKCSANLVVEERRRQPGRGGVVPPSFLSTIQNTSVTTGQLARFDAKVTGTKPLDVYWLKNGKKVTADIRYKTLEEDNIYTLLILETIPDDSGKYECVAINSAGEARCDAECTVRGPQSPTKTAKPTTPGVEKAPSVLEPLKDQTIKEGTSVAFACKITGKPVPTVQWKKGDKVIKPSKYFQMQKDGDLCTLKITEAFPEDEGVYKCIAKNPAGDVTTSANLRVLAPDAADVLPKLSPLKDQIVSEGQPAQFKTQVTPAKPKPTIQWYREGALIPQSPDFQMIHEGNNAVLLIATTYEEDTGTFSCRATTSAGTVETSAKLIVKSKN